MKTFVLKRPELNTLDKTEASYLKNFKLARVNWELNRQEDRLFKHEDGLMPTLRKSSS